jgi:uncharacterized membrane protein
VTDFFSLTSCAVLYVLGQFQSFIADLIANDMTHIARGGVICPCVLKNKFILSIKHL